MSDGRDIVTDQEQARIERAEVEARREAVEEYAQERRQEAKREELEKLRNGDTTDDEPPGFTEWVRGGLQRLFAGLKAVDQQMVENHSRNGDGDDTGRSFEALDSDREPQMPDPLGDPENDDTPRFGP